MFCVSLFSHSNPVFLADQQLINMDRSDHLQIEHRDSLDHDSWLTKDWFCRKSERTSVKFS